MQPQLVVVLVDEDGIGERYPSMNEWVTDLIRGRPPIVVAVAKLEFESWLVTDRACVERVLGSPFAVDGDPETWAPRTAKAHLERAIEAAGRSSEARELRRSICGACELETLRVGSRSFGRFLTDLSNAPVVGD